MQKVLKLLKKQINPHPVLIVAAGVFVIMLITAIGGIANYNSQLNQEISKPEVTQITAKKQVDEAKSKQKSENAQSTKNSGSADSSGQASGIKAQTPQATSDSSLETSSSTSGPNKSEAPKYINVNLSINGSFAGAVSLKDGSSQCQVLSAALAQNVIWELYMPYFEQFGTYGVYTINGQGSRNTTEWVYYVNGDSPDYGCSYLKAIGGDNVNWKYLKK